MEREAAKALKRQAKAEARAARKPFGKVMIAGAQSGAVITDSSELSESRGLIIRH